MIPGAAGSREVCVASQRPSAGRQQWIYSVASAVDRDCSRTAPGHCYVSTQQLQQRQVPQRSPTAVTILGTLPVTTCQSERVFSKLQRKLTSIRSTVTQDRLEALLLLQCHRHHCPTPDDVLSAFAKKARHDSTSFCSRNCWTCSVHISAAFCPLSCIRIHVFYFTLQSRTLK